MFLGSWKRIIHGQIPKKNSTKVQEKKFQTFILEENHLPMVTLIHGNNKSTQTLCQSDIKSVSILIYLYCLNFPSSGYRRPKLHMLMALKIIVQNKVARIPPRTGTCQKEKRNYHAHQDLLMVEMEETGTGGLQDNQVGISQK